jgi:hypothetical protein
MQRSLSAAIVLLAVALSRPTASAASLTVDTVRYKLKGLRALWAEKEEEARHESECAAVYCEPPTCDDASADAGCLECLYSQFKYTAADECCPRCHDTPDCSEVSQTLLL